MNFLMTLYNKFIKPCFLAKIFKLNFFSILTSDAELMADCLRHVKNF